MLQCILNCILTYHFTFKSRLNIHLSYLVKPLPELKILARLMCRSRQAKIVGARLLDFVGSGIWMGIALKLIFKRQKSSACLVILGSFSKI